MPNRPTSLLALRAFDAAARHLSFTCAARELHVSQAAISRHVRALEEDLGRLLFRRLHRQVELTVPGKRLAGELSAGFSQIKRAVDAVRATPTNRLRISVEPAFAARWLVPRFGRFTTAHPDIEVDMESSEELRTLGRDTDIAIRFLDSVTRKPGGSARKLFAVAGFPVIASDKSFGGSRRRSDQDVLGFRLLHDDDGTVWRRWFAAAGLTGLVTAPTTGWLWLAVVAIGLGWASILATCRSSSNGRMQGPSSSTQPERPSKQRRYGLLGRGSTIILRAPSTRDVVTAARI